MDDVVFSVKSLNDLIGRFPPPLILDVRRRATFEAAGDMIPGALYRDPERLAEWAGELEIGRRVVVYCAKGHEVGQTAASRLRERGFAAGYLADGMAGWRAEGLPVAPKTTAPATQWVTRERPKIDRIACPWLIRRFIDPEARFLYVPPDNVLATAEKTGAVPYDIPGVAFSHEGARCSFDAFIKRYELHDLALDELAKIVRGADTSRLDLTPQSAGLFAISLGLSAVFEDDHLMLRHGLVVYDALYAWCRSLRGETHQWPPVMPAPAAREGRR